MPLSRSGASSRQARRLVSAWFACEDTDNIDRLKPHESVVSTIGLFGQPLPQDFAQYLAEKGIGTFLLVSGEASAFDTPAHAKATIDHYLAQCLERGYGGIDLDFEHFGIEYRPAFSSFMRDLSSALHESGRRLSVCAEAFALSRHKQPSREHFHDPAVLGEACDEIRVMCYDHYFAPHVWLGPTSSWPWARDAMLFWLQHVPREKLIMGLPAYGNDYDLRPGSGHGQQTEHDSPATVPGAHAVEKAWLRHERLNVYRYLDGNEHPRLLYASDGDSTRAHLETVTELDLPGICFWHYDTITAGIWQAVEHWLDARIELASEL